jgi:imidazolonepropionase-like amidohydrolase
LPFPLRLADTDAVTFRFRGVVLPDGEERELYVDGDRITFDPLRSADTVVNGGWLIPGLVDVHTHMGAEEPADPLDEGLLRQHAEAHRDAGVTLVRSPGAVADYPIWLDAASDLPRVRSAGPWLAPEGGFFEGAGRQVPLEELPDAAEEQARSTGWSKVIVDWVSTVNGVRRYEPTVPSDVLADIVERVHSVGGRVAAHSQHGDGGAAAVAAGVDSLEHGMHLPHDRLDEMALVGSALVPTLMVFQRSQPARDTTEPLGRFFRDGTVAHPALIQAAHEAGVTILAGTDSPPFGNVAAEVAALVDAGLPPEVALGAASWTARSFLGLPGIEEGAPADIVAFERDPRSDPRVVAQPTRIVLRGRLVR